MGNRKQPFGYQMQFGTVAVRPQEAELVQYIFQPVHSGSIFSGVGEYIAKSGSSL